MNATTLSERQVACLLGKADGKNNDEIAASIEVNASTVVKELYTIYRLMGVRNAPAAVAEGFRRGLLKLEPAKKTQFQKDIDADYDQAHGVISK